MGARMILFAARMNPPPHTVDRESMERAEKPDENRIRVPAGIRDCFHKPPKWTMRQ